MKRILAILLVLVVSLTAFVGCEKLDIPGVDLPEFKRPEIKLPGFLQPLFPNWGKDQGDNNDGTDAVEYDVAAATEYVKQKYVETTVTTGDYEVVAQVMVAGVKYTVDWTVDNEKVKLIKNETTWTVDIDNKSPEEYTYKLTATITAGDNTQGTVSFDIKVPAYNISSFEDYMKAEKGDILTVEGIVVAMCSKDAGAKRNHIYVADASGVGGYLNYNMSKDPVKDLGIQVGMTVTISGEISPSNGMQEFYAANVEIVDKTIKEVPVTDITSIFAAGGNLDNYVATLVTIKGVTIGGQSMAEANHQYLRFSIGEYGSYIRTYLTDFPSTLTAKDNTDKDIIDKAHADHFGWTANVTGILVYFTTSENPYLIPISTDCFEYLEFVEKSDADKVAYEKGNLTFEENLTSDTVIDLVVKGANYPEVTISWAADSDSVVIADGKATVTIPDEAVTVKLTATITCGDVTETKEFEVKLSKDLTPVKDAIDIALGKEHNTYTDGKYLVGGIITEVYNTTYGNMKITDENGNILTIYGTYGADGANRYDALEAKPVAGDYVVVFGILGQYSGTAQMKNGWIISFTTPTSVKDAIDLGAAKEHNDFTGDKILVTGTVTDVYNTTYGNMYITDADGNVLTIYGTYDATGANRYDAMATKPVAGDVVTILGVPGRYNDTKQIKNGWIVAITTATTDDPTDNPTDDPTDDPTDEPTDEPTDTTLAVVDPVVDTAYKFGMVQGNLNNAIYYLVGGMDGHYMATTTDASAALDVYLEATDGGYHMYCYVDGAKTYINFVVSGTYVNGAYEAAASTVYTYDADKKTVVASVDGTPYWLATRNDNTYTTMGPSKVSYAGFYGQFYGEAVAHEHNFVAGTPVAATCTTGGYTPYTCDCGETENRDVVEALNHVGTETTTTTVDAKCGVAGSTTVTCECGHVISTTELPALEHNYVDGVCQNGCGVPEEHVCDFVAGTPVAATCTTNGYTPYTCSCGASENRDVVEALNHVGTKTETVTVDAKCGVAGSTTVTCECGEILSTTEIAALEHVDENGDYKCDHACGTNVLPAADSAITISQAIAIGKLYTKNNYTTDKYYITGTITEVQNTMYGNVLITDGTATILVYGIYSYDGSIRYDALEYKPVVGDEVTVYGVLGYYNDAQMKNSWLDEVVAHEHNYVAEVTDPTCTEAGYTTYTCSVCDGSYVEDGEEALGHTTENGVCDNCGNTIGGETTVTPEYVKITSADQFTTGTYVLIVSTKNVTVSTFDGSWIKGSELKAGDTIAKADGDKLAITLEVNGSSVKIKIGGQYVKPKSGNNNGIQSGSYDWAYEFKADGTIVFKGVGSDTTILAYNVQSSGFRAYKTSTVSGNPGSYPSTFSVYKLVEA